MSALISYVCVYYEMEMAWVQIILLIPICLKHPSGAVVLSVIMFPHVRFEVFKAVTMKNAIFWNIKTQFVLHRRHITSPLQSPAS
jgi:hypothetical protein